MSELQTPLEEEVRAGQEAYIQYLGGIAILHQPDSEFAINFHQLDINQANLSAIVTYAERLMYSGALSVISHSNSGISTRREMERNYENALPNIWHIIDAAFAASSERIALLGKAYVVLRPAAFTDKVIYHHIAHPHREKLFTSKLMDGLPPAGIFEAILADRTL